MLYLLPFFMLGAIAAGVAGWKMDISRVFMVSQPAVVCLSIMAAAIFVRLNRGMPTLDWKTIKIDDRKRLTKSIESLAHDYIVGLAFTSLSIFILVALLGLGPAEAVLMPENARRAAVACFVLAVSFSLVWMGYVIWRDYDIVRLQRTVIDDAADREARDKQVAEAERKTSQMRSSATAVEPTKVKPFGG